MSKRIEMTGQRFTKWTVEAFDRSDKRFAYWRVRCDCGAAAVVRGDSLRAGGSTMCQPCQIVTLAEKVTTHGLSASLTWKSWHSMRMRCLSAGAADYPRYGGAGIIVCGEWADFTRFLSDMGERPSRAHSIDRIDPTGNYEPSNCRWATTIEQGRNKRRTVWLTSGGEKLPLTAWAERLGVRTVTLYKRHVAGWSDDDVVTRPVAGRTRVQG
jgi:hypothetical protein